jgi:hypothetical protein
MNTLFDYAQLYAETPPHDPVDEMPFLSRVLVGNPIGFYEYLTLGEKTLIWKCLANIRLYYGIQHYDTAVAIMRKGPDCQELKDFKAAFEAAPLTPHRLILLDSHKHTIDELPDYDGAEEALDISTDLLDSKIFHRPGNDIIFLSTSLQSFQDMVAASTSLPVFQNAPELTHSISVFNASVTTRDSFLSLMKTMRRAWKNVENRNKFVYISQKNLLFLRRVIREENPAYVGLFDLHASNLEEIEK